MRFLKTNTAVRLTVGPFLDKTDGVTPETALTVTSCKLTLMVDDGNVPTLVLDTAPTASGGANDMVHVTGDDAGFYDLELAAGNVNYLGRAMLAITDAATHCPVFHEFMILPANVYDSLVLGTDTLQADVTQWLGTAAATPTVAGVPEVDITHISGSAVSTSTAQLGVNAVQAGGTAWGSGAITAASIANGAIDAATFAADVDAEILSYLVDDATRIDASALNTHSAITAAGIADVVWDEDATAHQTQGTFGQAIGDPGADTDTIWGLANTNLNATVGSRASQTSVDTIDDLLDTEVAALTTELAKVPKSDGTASWNATALAAIQSEANDALVAQNLDHLVKAAVDTDFATTVHLDSVIGHLADAGTTATFDRTTDSAEAIQAAIDTIDNFLDTEIAAILEDTGSTLQAELDGIQADTEDIQARLPAALTAGGNIKADVLAVSGDTTAADRLEALMDGTIVAQVNDVGASTTAFIADGFTEATNDHFIGRLITFISGALSGQQTAITDYVGATQTFTVTALTEAPANDDFFVIH